MEQDWLFGLAGGGLIGLAGALYLLGNGRVMGASGIIGGLVDRSGWSTWAERVAFLSGLVLLPLLLLPLYEHKVATHLTGNMIVVIAAGLLVGVGTRVANGCTSGHGVCGISRLSPRGMLATVCYIAAGGATLLVLRHALGVI